MDEDKICRICCDRRECQQCERRLQQRLTRKGPTHVTRADGKGKRTVRTAVDRIVQKREIATSELDVYHTRLPRQHQDEVVRTLEDAVN